MSYSKSRRQRKLEITIVGSRVQTHEHKESPPSSFFCAGARPRSESSVLTKHTSPRTATFPCKYYHIYRFSYPTYPIHSIQHPQKCAKSRTSITSAGTILTKSLTKYARAPQAARPVLGRKSVMNVLISIVLNVRRRGMWGSSLGIDFLRWKNAKLEGTRWVGRD